MKRTGLLVTAALVLFAAIATIAAKHKMDETACYMKSLHATGAGMKYWYEKKDGFKSITGIPYEQLDCKNCHADNCEKCHSKKTAEGNYTADDVRNKELCLKCHTRAKTCFKIDTKEHKLDLHIAQGMGCSDCHGKEDVHGDCTSYKSMRDKGAVKADCTNCHSELSKNTAHVTHEKTLDCNACHVSSTLSCYNCHFDGFLATKQRKGNFIPGNKCWVMLVNHNGKVTSGNVQTLVYKGKKFIAYAPYFTHSVMKKARQCDDCHDNEAMKLLNSGKKIPVTTFANGKIDEWKGVFPLVRDELSWVFLDKKDGKWVEIKDGKEPKVQYACDAKPLTKKQIKSLSQPYKE
ncbi:MAG: hypothetical protein JW838_14220 [Spirochaetes bacterium]|nr:hypothetical protein [Spirochaetota bacterium]